MIQGYIPAQRSLLCFSYAHSVFLAQALLPFGKQNIKGVTWKNSNTVFVAQCDSNVVKRGRAGVGGMLTSKQGPRPHVN